MLSTESGSKKADALLLVEESVGMRLSLSNSRRSPFSSKGFEHCQVPFYMLMILIANNIYKADI